MYFYGYFIYIFYKISYNKGVVEHCRIQIVTETEGRKSVFKGKGTLFRSDEEWTVRYREENDFVTLRAYARKFDMERSPRLYMHFLPDEETDARLVYDCNSGGFSVFTSFYSFHQSDSGRRAKIGLRYELRFPGFIQKFSVNIFVQIISEKL